MLSFYTRENGRLIEQDADTSILHHQNDLAWVDIIDITKNEEKLLEKIFHINVPTREEMGQLELSSRLYVEDSAVFATATMISNAGTSEMAQNPVTFILAKGCLITLRYSDPRSFKLFTSRLQKIRDEDIEGTKLLGLLLETITDRYAEILNTTGHRLDEMTKELFFTLPKEGENTKTRDLEETMRLIGVNGDVVSKSVESLMSFARMVVFLRQLPMFRVSDGPAKLDAVSSDITGLLDHTSFLSNKVNFLLDATLGMLSIQQNAIIKIFSVAAVIFLPPTLVASIYGMNFEFMPELHFRFGYPMALFMMVLSALIPYAFFRRKGWL